MPSERKQKIAQTLTQLLARKKLEKITVKELVEACHISRQAFYYHFQDIMEVVEYLMEQRMQKALDVSLAAPSMEEAIKAVIVTTLEEKTLIRHLLASQRKEELVLLLNRASHTYFDQLIREKADSSRLSAAGLETAIRFYTYGVVGLLLDNLAKEQDPDVLAGQIRGLISGEIWKNCV